MTIVGTDFVSRDDHDFSGWEYVAYVSQPLNWPTDIDATTIQTHKDWDSVKKVADDTRYPAASLVPGYYRHNHDLLCRRRQAIARIDAGTSTDSMDGIARRLFSISSAFTAFPYLDGIQPLVHEHLKRWILAWQSSTETAPAQNIIGLDFYYRSDIGDIIIEGNNEAASSSFEAPEMPLPT